MRKSLPTLVAFHDIKSVSMYFKRPFEHGKTKCINSFNDDAMTCDKNEGDEPL
jgi:hypothetical protein